MNRLFSLAAFALLPATPALADHAVIYGPRAEAFAAGQVTQGPGVVGSQAHIVNGVLQPGSNYAGNSGSTAAGPVGPGGTSGWAQTTQDGGFGTLSAQTQSYASANLATGILRASVTSQGDEIFGSPRGFASARLDDTIFFTNLSGASQLVTFTYRFDGQLLNTHNSNPGGNVTLGFACFSGTCYNDSGDRIVFGTGPTRTPSDNWNYYFSSNGDCFGENIYCGQGAAPYFQWGLYEPRTDGVVDGYIRTSLLIPTGLTSIGVRGTLDLDCGSGSSCDFGHTGRFAFDPLPKGLTYGSASGVFLTDFGNGVPEPDAWAMLIGGMGLIGGVARRRKGATRTVLA